MEADTDESKVTSPTSSYFCVKIFAEYKSRADARLSV